MKIQYEVFVFIFFLSFPFLCPSCQHLRSPRDYLLLHFSTRRFSRFFLYSIIYPWILLPNYLSMFIDLTLSFYPHSISLSNASLTSNKIPHFASCRNTIQPFNCRYGCLYSAAVNNRLHVLFLMWGYFFFSKTTILRVRFRQLLDVAMPIKRVPTYFLPPSEPLAHRWWETFLFNTRSGWKWVQSSRETWKKCVISYKGALKNNPPQPLNTHTHTHIYIYPSSYSTHSLVTRICVCVCIAFFVLPSLSYLNTPRMYYTALPTSLPLKCFYCSVLFLSCHTIIWNLCRPLALPYLHTHLIHTHTHTHIHLICPVTQFCNLTTVMV